MKRVLVFAALAACSADEAPPCNATTNLGCAPELQCEVVQGLAAPTCLSPVVLRGHVRDIATTTPVVRARVIVFDAGGAPISAATATASDGSYEVRLHAPRDASFKPTSRTLTVAVQASGYGNFPDRWRPAAPIDVATAQATPAKDQLVVSGPGSEVTLFPFGGGSGIGVLSGTLPLPSPPGPVLVIAAADQSFGGPVGVATLADQNGAYTLFGLPPASYVVRAYARGTNYLPVPISLSSGEQTVQNLPADPTPASRVLGKVAAPAGPPPKVALYVAATWNASSAEGDAPLGLSTTVAADGSFAVTGVPAGRYAVVASPDADGLARIGAPAFVDVQAGRDASLAAPIQVVPAVRIVGPGADAPELLGAPPTLRWSELGGEASYHVAVTSAVGVVVWEKDLPAGTTSVPYGGPFAPGNWYHATVVALDARAQPIAQSEDLAGIFYSAASQG